MGCDGQTQAILVSGCLGGCYGHDAIEWWCDAGLGRAIGATPYTPYAVWTLASFKFVSATGSNLYAA